MQTFIINVESEIQVTLDESKFTKEFLADFREHFYPFTSLEQHACHLAQLQARGLIDEPQTTNRFIEGYGPANEMGIETVTIDCEAFIVGKVAPAKGSKNRS